MTVEAFTPETEKRNVGEINHKDGSGSTAAATILSSDFLSDYLANPNKARQDWQGTPAGNFHDGLSAAINPDAHQLPSLELIDNITNEQAISPLLANQGALFDKLDNYESSGAPRDGNIGAGDLNAYLNDSNNDKNSSDYKFVQHLNNGLIVDNNGDSVLNGDGGIDRDQLGRLTGIDLSNQNLSASDVADRITGNTQEQLTQLSQQAAFGTPDRLPTDNQAPPVANPGDNPPPEDDPTTCAPPSSDQSLKHGDKRAMSDSVAQPGDGYIKVAARLLGINNTDDPNVLQGAKELHSLNPGERKDGWLDLNEQVLTPDTIEQARSGGDQYRVVDQMLDRYEHKAPDKQLLDQDGNPNIDCDRPDTGGGR